ncbi:hypothetical protein, partial [Kitasatospora cineracea]
RFGRNRFASPGAGGRPLQLALYAAGCLAAGRASRSRTGSPGPRRTRPGGRAAAAALLTSSTAATWWVYDRSELRTFDWLEELLPAGPGEHLVLSSGLDEAGRPVAARWPQHPRPWWTSTTPPS